MKISYLVGNGLDLHIGLKTSYRDFYDFLNENKSNNIDNQIYQSIINNSLKINKDTEKVDWSDFEIAIGDYTHKNFNGIDLQKFSDDYEQFIEDFTDFIDNQIKKVDRSTFVANAFKTFNDSINKPINLPSRDRMNLESDIKINNAKQLITSFIVFNYTEVFDEIFNFWKNNIKQTKIIPTAPLHIHGYCQEEVLLGVNDVSQIHSDFCENEIVKTMMVKTYANKFSSSRRFEEAEEIIKDTNLFVIFGMSLGDSDKIWWEKIISNLELNKGNKVLIYAYENKSKKINKHLHHRNTRKKVWQDKLVKHSKKENNIDLYNQIFVQFETEKIFNFDKIKSQISV